MTTRALLLVAAVGALAVGCSDAPQTGGASTGAPTATSSTPEPLDPEAEDIGTVDPSPSVQPASVNELAASCDVATPAGSPITIAHPDGWQVGDECRFFDPELDEVPSGEPTGIDVVVDVVPTSFAEVAADQPTRTDAFRAVGAVDGRQAVRIEATTTGTGEVPADRPLVTWVVDLDPGTDEGAGTLVATVTGGQDVDTPTAVATLDAMMRAVDLGDTPSQVVTVVEGGGTPYAVRLEDGCLVLAPSASGEPVDQACDVVDLDDNAARVTTLSGLGTTVAVGQVDEVVELVRDDGVDGVGAVTWPSSDQVSAPRLFALRAADDATLRLLSFDGTDRGRLTVGAR